MKSCQFLLTPVPNVTYSACLVDKIEEMFADRPRALSGGAHVDRQRHARKLPDIEARGQQASGDAASQRALSGAEDEPARGGVTNAFQIACINSAPASLRSSMFGRWPSFGCFAILISTSKAGIFRS